MGPGSPAQRPSFLHPTARECHLLGEVFHGHPLSQHRLGRALASLLASLPELSRKLG